MLEAATRLFVERGYTATSIEDIAAAAGVSRATVFTAVGGKPLLLKTAFDVALVGDDEPVSLPDRQRSRAIHEEPDATRYLALYAELVIEIDGRLAAIYSAVRDAAGADEEVREVWETHLAQRRQGAANVVRAVRERQALRDGLDEVAAADIIWVLNDPGLYDQLVRRRGWAAERFGTWLAQTMRQQLLGDGDVAGSPPRGS